MTRREVERLRREVEHWQACHRLLANHIASTAVARANWEEDHRELLLRAATALRAVVHSSVGSRELLDLAEQLEHAMGDPEPRG